MSPRSAISRLIVAVLSLQLVLPLLVGTGQARLAPEEAGPAFEVVLCTPSGLKLVAVDANGEARADGKATNRFCPICLALGAALAGPAQDMVALAPLPGRIPVPRAQVVVHAVPAPVHGVPPVRAPPLV